MKVDVGAADQTAAQSHKIQQAVDTRGWRCWRCGNDVHFASIRTTVMELVRGGKNAVAGCVVLPFFDNNGIRTKPHKPLRGGTSRLKSLSRKGRRYLPHYSITSFDHPVGVA